MSLAFGSILRGQLRGLTARGLCEAPGWRVPVSDLPIPFSPAGSRSFSHSNRYSLRSWKSSKSEPETKKHHEEVNESAESRFTQEAPPARLQPGPNHERNSFLRAAFQAHGQAICEAADEMMSSPYVPVAFTYPNDLAVNRSLRTARSAARAQIGFEVLAHRRRLVIPKWTQILKRMEEITHRSERPQMAAMRVLLPASLLATLPKTDSELTPQMVKYIESTTGLLAKLRVSPGDRGDLQPRSVILRGEESTLARAADELVAASPEIEVSQLGGIATIAYKEKQLWPVLDLDEAAGRGALVQADSQSERLWAHQELESYWIDRPYEETPKPTKWTKNNFQDYITKLVCGRLRSHLVMPMYAKPTPAGSIGVDADGIRAKLIMAAFKDPAAASSITPQVLKMAMNFLSIRGAHTVEARELFHLADKCGIPMDTDVFNILLHGYVHKRDVWHFYQVLRMMRDRYFHATSWTWLLFLRLVPREVQQRRIIVAAFEAGLLKDRAMHRGVVAIMAPYHAHKAFWVGQSPKALISDLNKTYGKDWFTSGAQHAILMELLSFHPPQENGSTEKGLQVSREADVKELLAIRAIDGPLKIETINDMLDRSIANMSWTFAVIGLEYANKHRIKLNHSTYEKLMKLSLATDSPHCLATVFFFAIVEGNLQSSARSLMRNKVLRRFRPRLWSRRDITIGSHSMAMEMLPRQRYIKSTEGTLSVVEQSVFRECNDGKVEFTQPLCKVLKTATTQSDFLPSRGLRGPKIQSPDADSDADAEARLASRSPIWLEVRFLNKEGKRMGNKGPYI